MVHASTRARKRWTNTSSSAATVKCATRATPHVTPLFLCCVRVRPLYALCTLIYTDIYNAFLLLCCGGDAITKLVFHIYIKYIYKVWSRESQFQFRVSGFHSSRRGIAPRAKSIHIGKPRIMCLCVDFMYNPISLYPIYLCAEHCWGIGRHNRYTLQSCIWMFIVGYIEYYCVCNTMWVRDAVPMAF